MLPSFKGKILQFAENFCVCTGGCAAKWMLERVFRFFTTYRTRNVRPHSTTYVWPNFKA